MIEINLLKKDKTRRKIDFSSYLGGAIVLFVALLIVEVAFLAYYTMSLNTQYNSLSTTRDKLRSVEREVKRIRAKLKEVRVMTATIKKLGQNRGMAYRILKDVADLMPDGLWLVRLTKRDNVLFIEGKSFTTEAVAEYMTNLGNLKYVANVRFNGSGLVRLQVPKKSVNVYKFYIKVTLKV